MSLDLLTWIIDHVPKISENFSKSTHFNHSHLKICQPTSIRGNLWQKDVTKQTEKQSTYNVGLLLVRLLNSEQ